MHQLPTGPANRDTLIQTLQAAFSAAYEEWEPLLLARAPMGAINTIPQVVAHPRCWRAGPWWRWTIRARAR